MVALIGLSLGSAALVLLLFGGTTWAQLLAILVLFGVLMELKVIDMD
jgi:hypothetical protein